MTEHSLLALFVAVLVGMGSAALAEDRAADAPSAIRLELNKLEPQGDACRVYMVFANEGDGEISSLRLDLISFDPDGIINRRVALEGGPLAGEKTAVKLFDLADIECGEVGRLLLNDVVACEGDGVAGDCLGRIETHSRAEAAFGK